MKEDYNPLASDLRELMSAIPPSSPNALSSVFIPASFSGVGVGIGVSIGVAWDPNRKLNGFVDLAPPVVLNEFEIGAC
jgi:hypothetical protein